MNQIRRIVATVAIVAAATLGAPTAHAVPTLNYIGNWYGLQTYCQGAPNVGYPSGNLYCGGGAAQLRNSTYPPSCIIFVSIRYGQAQRVNGILYWQTGTQWYSYLQDRRNC